MKPNKCVSAINADYNIQNKLEYISHDKVRLDLPFILTENKTLVIGMPYLLIEEYDIDAIRLMRVWDKDGYVYLKIENLQTKHVGVISWLIDYDGDYWIWSLRNLSYL